MIHTIEEFFINEPQEDFSDPQVQKRIEEGIRWVELQLIRPSKSCYPIIGGEDYIDLDMSRGYIDVHSPSRIHNFRIGRVYAVDVKAIEKACALARIASKQTIGLFWDNPAVWLKKRKKVIENACSLLQSERYKIAPIISTEVSKSLKGAFGENNEAIGFGKLYLRDVDSAFQRILVQPNLQSEANFRIIVPRGPSLVIKPWNFPLSLSFEAICASYLMGCSVLYKPAEQSLLTGWYLVKLLLRAGMEPDMIAYLPGYGDVGEALVKHPYVAQISFTGSDVVGHIISEESTKAVSKNSLSFPYGIKRVEAELGGNNPMVITRSANIDDAIKAVIASKWEQQGEKCSAEQRVYIVAPHDHLFSKTIMSRLRDAVLSLEYGDPLRGKKNYNAIIDKVAYDRIRIRIEECKKIKDPFLEVDLSHLQKGGYFIGPVIFEGIPHDSSLVGEEIFGPVLFVFFVDTLEEAVRLANAYPHITAGIFTNSEREKKYFLREMLIEGNAGILYINREIIGAIEGRHQFGPINRSGSGYKLGTKERLRFFVNEVGVTENYLSQGVISKV